MCWIIHVGEFYGPNASLYVESRFKLGVMNGHGEVPPKMNCDCFIEIELMYFFNRLWTYCVA